MAVRTPATMTRHGQAAVQAAEQLTDPVLTAVALVLCSWSVSEGLRPMTSSAWATASS